MGLEDKVSIKIVDDKMIISPIKSSTREGWEKMLAEDVAKFGQIWSTREVVSRFL